MNTRSGLWKRLTHLLIGLILVLAMFRPVGDPTLVAHAAGPYVVDTATDRPDSNPADGVCFDGVDGCSLRAAIQQASFDGLPTTITFGLPLAGLTLLVDNAYGTILWVGDNITVTGESNSISISGANLNTNNSIFKIEGNHNLLENLTVEQAPRDGIEVGDFAGTGAGNNNTVSKVNVIQSSGSGIYVFGGSGGLNNTITGSKIGATNLLAPCGLGNNIGVTVGSGAAGTLVTLSDIVCNLSHGVQITSSTSVSLTHNGIGIGFALDLGNGGAGVYATGTTGTYIASNLISGNGSDGILFGNSIQALIQGNYIGANGNGTAAVPNDAHGVALTAGSDNNTIGGANNSDGNLISGNLRAGVLIDASNGNVVSRNLIGLNNPTTGALPNGQVGVWINNGSNGNTVGSGDVNQAQYIGGNTSEGVLILNSNGNYVSVSNRIGVGLSGNAIGNGDRGVFIIDSADNTVNPTLVANNGGAGLAATGITSTGNYLRPLHVYGNKGIPVDLQADGPTPNDGDDDTGTGANNLLEYPVITASTGDIITGTVCANCSVFVYQAIGNPATAGGGGDFVQLVLADGSGQWSTTLGVGLTRLSVSLQAYDNASNTSELSPRPILFLPLTRR